MYVDSMSLQLNLHGKTSLTIVHNYRESSTSFQGLQAAQAFTYSMLLHALVHSNLHPSYIGM